MGGMFVPKCSFQPNFPPNLVHHSTSGELRLEFDILSRSRREKIQICLDFRFCFEIIRKIDSASCLDTFIRRNVIIFSVLTNKSEQIIQQIILSGASEST